MREFWKLISLTLSLLAFVLVSGMMLMRGESFVSMAIRGAAAFAALYVILNVFGAIFSAVAGTVGQQPQDDVDIKA